MIFKFGNCSVPWLVENKWGSHVEVPLDVLFLVHVVFYMRLSETRPQVREF
jgi:hypothetical protein